MTTEKKEPLVSKVIHLRVSISNDDRTMAQFVEDMKTRVLSDTFNNAPAKNATALHEEYIVDGKQVKVADYEKQPESEQTDVQTDEAAEAVTSDGEPEPEGDGTEGQDRESYTDDQDRESYVPQEAQDAVETKAVDPEAAARIAALAGKVGQHTTENLEVTEDTGDSFWDDADEDIVKYLKSQDGGKVEKYRGYGMDAQQVADTLKALERRGQS